MKQCVSCGTVSDNFSPDSRASDGLQSRCRTCVNAARKAKYQANPEQARKRKRDYYEANKERVCEINARSREKNKGKVAERKRDYYERVKVTPEFKAKTKKRQLKNKARKREYDREYRAKNADHLKKIKDRWRAENPALVTQIKKAYRHRRRAWAKGGDSTAEIHEWQERQEKSCHWCGCECADDFHLDHVMPLSRGGRHEVANLVISCPSCNSKKSAMLPDEWAHVMEASK